MWLWRVKWRWVWLVWGGLVRTCHPGQTYQVSWLGLSKNIFWNHSTSSSILSKVLVKPWSLLLTKIKVYFYSRGSQIQCASIEHPSTLGALLYFYLFWPLLYSIFSHFSHILFLHFVTWHSLWIAKWEFHHAEMRFWCGWGKTWICGYWQEQPWIHRPHPLHSNQLPSLSQRRLGCCFPPCGNVAVEPSSRDIFPRHFALIGDNNAWSKQGIRSRARWCHILPSLHYGGYIYYIMMCCANKTFGCHGHAHLLDSAPREELFSCFLPASSSTVKIYHLF